jgi:signal transduction histidine kinase
MSLRLVKGARKGEPRAAETGALALLIVNVDGAVADSSGWETVSVDPVPSRIGGGRGEDPILRAAGEAAAEARRTRRPSARAAEVSLDRTRLYSITAAPLPGRGKGRAVSVVVHEVPLPGAGRTEGRVIRQLGHDLRTPLTSISGAVELMQSGRLGACPPQQVKVLGMMQKAVDAMVRLIDEATAPYRREAGADLDLAALAAGLRAGDPPDPKKGR